MPPSLALELYYSIIKRVEGKPDLCSLALCCSAFRDEAQRCLFNYLQPTSPDQEERVLSAIIAAPLRLGPLVHAFSIHRWAGDNTGHILSRSKALRAMSSLRHLRLFLWIPSTILQGFVTQLWTLDCAYALVQEEVHFLLYEFLPTQKAIKRLAVDSFDSITAKESQSEVPMDLCPQLESLRIDNEILASVLLPSTRVISQLQWRGLGTLQPPLTIRQFNHLKSLTLNMHVKLDIDTSFSAQLICLINLKLHIFFGIGDIQLPDASNLLLPLISDLTATFLSL